MLGGDSWQTVPWHQLTPAIVSGLVTKLAEQYKPGYVNTILAAIRGVVEQAHDLGQMEDRTYRRILKVKRVAGGGTEPSGRYVPRGERAAMMEACLRDHTPAGRRDAGILVCGYPGGLRRAEIAGLRRGDLTDDGETITLQEGGQRTLGASRL